jgi:hypothetical protein
MIEKREESTGFSHVECQLCGACLDKLEKYFDMMME